MNTNTQTRPWVRLCTGALAAGGLAMSALGLSTGTAAAAPPPPPMYHHHWCPGDQWDPGWGPYQNWNNCRDWDDNNGGPGDQAGYGAPPWAGPPPPPPPWAPWAHIIWDPGMNHWGYWEGPNWRPV
ncbi:hypothetical protein [Mycobacterium colombiense]|uniref:hypothetical protein n=1 Tax=Mycobacterium colombiense TaxID=339268 RepID=UPI00200A03E6|nr:hypothetical protein [Mycobacterium colombiense]MCK8643280.1 hypothetical protein [Mycobacterium colombiense]